MTCSTVIRFCRDSIFNSPSIGALFHRAILMSGSALSPNVINTGAIKSTREVRWQVGISIENASLSLMSSKNLKKVVLMILQKGLA